MALTIGSNIASLQAQRQLGETSNSLAQVFERLASGQRINRASDDAASLSVSAGLDNRARVLNQAVRNVNDGISALNIVDSALSTLSSITTRQIELAEQSANGSLSYEQREALNTEYNELVREYNRITQTTTFNDISLLEDPNSTNISIQAGVGSDGSIDFDIGEELERLVGTGDFLNSGSFGPASSTGAAQLADVNNDGLADLVQSRSGAGVVISLGDGTGNFSLVASYTDVTSTNISSGVLFLEDFDGDGNLDLMATNGTDRTISLGNGDGTFQSAQSISLDVSSSFTFTSGDFDGDGNTDFAYQDASDELVIEYGNGDGTFSSLQTVASGGIIMTGGDFNGDGRTDLVVRNGTIGEVLLSTDEGFENVGGSLSFSFSDAAVFDVNQDGFDDIILQSDSSPNITIRLSNGDGTLSLGESINTGLITNDLVADDFNGDGINDLLVGFGSSTQQIYSANGDGTFSLFSSFSATLASGERATGDINGDGVADVLSRFSSGTVLTTLIQETEGSNQQAFEDITTQAGALSALDTAQENLDRIVFERGALGAVQSRFNSAIRSISAEVENSKAASSRIKDADIAQESSELTRLTILQNAAQSVLSQANQQPALALRLLS